MLVPPPISLPEEFWALKINEDKTINFFSLYSLYKEETELKLREGYGALLEKFERYGVTDVIDPTRPKTTKAKSYWLLRSFLGPNSVANLFTTSITAAEGCWRERCWRQS